MLSYCSCLHNLIVRLLSLYTPDNMNMKLSFQLLLLSFMSSILVMLRVMLRMTGCSDFLRKYMYVKYISVVLKQWPAGHCLSTTDIH